MGVRVGDPGDAFDAECREDAEVEAAVAGAQRTQGRLLGRREVVSVSWWTLLLVVVVSRMVGVLLP